MFSYFVSSLQESHQAPHQAPHQAVHPVNHQPEHQVNHQVHYRAVHHQEKKNKMLCKEISSRRAEIIGVFKKKISPITTLVARKSCPNVTSSGGFRFVLRHYAHRSNSWPVGSTEGFW